MTEQQMREIARKHRRTIVGHIPYGDDDVAAAIAEAVAVENERLAQLCDDMALYTGVDCANAIRRRFRQEAGQEKEEQPEEETMKVEDIAHVCHDANRAYCASLGDHSQPPWEHAPEWQKKSAVQGVQAKLKKPDMTPEQQHASWMELKLSEGWVWGRVKDINSKQHPQLVPYEQLPLEQKLKDALFGAIVLALSGEPLSTAS